MGLQIYLGRWRSNGIGQLFIHSFRKKLYRNYYEKELEETKKSYDYEIQETEQLFQEQGFNTEDSKKLTQIVSKNTDFWVKFMVQYECDMDNPEGDSPLYCGLATFASFVFFGFIPLIPYFFNTDPSVTFIYSSLFTAGISTTRFFSSICYQRLLILFQLLKHYYWWHSRCFSVYCWLTIQSIKK